MNGSISNTEYHDTSTDSLFIHDQIKHEVFNKEDTIISKGPSKKSVQHRVASSVGHTGGSVSLSSFSVFEGLATKGSLIDLSLSSSGKGHTVTLEFENGSGGFSTHVVDGVLVAQPIGALHGIVSMPSPVVFGDVSQCSVDSSLGGDGVRSGGE